MRKTLPDAPMKTVDHLEKGAKLILERKEERLEIQSLILPIVVPPEVMGHLSTSIKYRELLTATKYDDANDGDGDNGDDGHRYMIKVLRYCRSVLKFSRQVARVALRDVTTTKSKTATENDESDWIRGRFHALLVDDDEEEEGDNLKDVEDNIRQRLFPNFTSPKAPSEQHKDMDIEQVLINGDDRFQAIALLRTMDDLMGAVDQHYGLLKQTLRGQQENENSSSSIIQLLMECAVVANLVAINNTRVAENTLYANQPHMSSCYDVIALVCLTHVVSKLEKKLTANKQRDPHMALQFVATIAECAFQYRGDTLIAAKVKRFVKKLGLPLATLEQEAKKIKIMTS
jgi:hypothetical protein